jgi:alpha-galactosidase
MFDWREFGLHHSPAVRERRRHMTRYERLDGGGTTLVMAIDTEDAPRLVYFGAALPNDTDLAALDAASAPLLRGSTPDRPPPHASILPIAGAGFMGEPGLKIATPIFGWASCACTRDDRSLSVTLTSDPAALTVTMDWRLDASTGVLATHAQARNDGAHDVVLGQLASLCMPLPGWARDIVCFQGDWAREAHMTRLPAPPGLWTQVNRTGRTGFSGSTFLVTSPDASDQAGRVMAIHLAWGGNHRLGVETDSDGARRAFAMAELGMKEIVIAPGAQFTTPVAYTAFSETGFNGVSDTFHPFVRAAILPPTSTPVRKVHFNSWEGVYFDFDLERLKTLCTEAAALGVERFVLDDGWFSGRRSDTAGLGDWHADAERFPHGLQPFIDHVHACGMDFGLWVEPEMVNPDSTLYRDHPEWCVGAPNGPRPTMRNQLWLDLGRADVRDHLFVTIDALLRAQDISYLKWDCNRTVFPDWSGDRPASHAMVHGFYDLLDRLRAAHPHVEIESCASGGARVDLEVLRRTSRVWPSDTTDALDRLRIQKWTGLLLPLETTGAHVGPSPNPITGRRLDMTLRARVAMFGHMGVELDPARLGDSDRACLAEHIALYKANRRLLHTGRRLCWTSDGGADCRMVIAPDCAEALALAVMPQSPAHATSSPVRFPGLERNARYVVTLPSPWPKLAARRVPENSAWRTEQIFSGAILSEAGLRLPLSDPETAWLVAITRV